MVRSIANRESDSLGAEGILNSLCFFDVATTVCVSWKSRFFLWKMISHVCQFRCIWDCWSSIGTILLFLLPPVCWTFLLFVIVRCPQSAVWSILIEISGELAALCRNCIVSASICTVCDCLQYRYRCNNEISLSTKRCR